MSSAKDEPRCEICGVGHSTIDWKKYLVSPHPCPRCHEEMKKTAARIGREAALRRERAIAAAIGRMNGGSRDEA